MNGIEILSNMLVSPKTVIRRIQELQFSAVLALSVLVFLLAQLSANISSFLMSGNPVTGFGFTMQSFGLLVMELVTVLVLAVFLHAVLNCSGYKGSFGRLVCCLLLAEVPFLYLPCVSFLAQAFKVFLGAYGLGKVFFGLAILGLWLKSIALILDSIKVHYGLENGAVAFFGLCVAVVLQIFLAFCYVAGAVLSTLGMAFNFV
jgi:hypothetical protein